MLDIAKRRPAMMAWIVTLVLGCTAFSLGPVALLLLMALALGHAEAIAISNAIISSVIFALHASLAIAVLLTLRAILGKILPRAK